MEKKLEKFQKIASVLLIFAGFTTILSIFAEYTGFVALKDLLSLELLPRKLIELLVILGTFMFLFGGLAIAAGFIGFKRAGQGLTRQILCKNIIFADLAIYLMYFAFVISVGAFQDVQLQLLFIIFPLLFLYSLFLKRKMSRKGTEQE